MSEPQHKTEPEEKSDADEKNAPRKRDTDADESPRKRDADEKAIAGKRNADETSGRRWRSRIFGFIFYTLLIAAVFTVVIYIASSAPGTPRVIFNHSFMRVLSPSMQSELPEGSLIIVRKTDPELLEIGDNITFLEANNTSTTHKIVQIYDNYTEDGQRGFLTQGTENVWPDRDIVIAQNVVGKVVFHTTLFAGIADAVAGIPALAADIWDFLLAYPVFLVIFPLLIIGLVISLKIFFSIKIPEEETEE
jgi:signal peptidase I